MVTINNLIVIEVPEDAYDFEIIGNVLSYIEKSTDNNHNVKLFDNCEILGKLSELPEEECKRLVKEPSKREYGSQGFSNCEINYYDYKRFHYLFDTAKESLISLLQSEGIDTTKNILLLEKL